MSIYDDLDLWPEDLRGWHGTDPIFAHLIHEVNPRTIFEVGAWKGQSTITMAKILKEENRLCHITTVDTWLGANEFIGAGGDWDLHLVNGYPQVYYQFLSNVVHNGVEDYITPFPNTSRIAARHFRKTAQTADLIYIDGSHEYDDVFDDLYDYFPLLNKGGIIFGDDYDSNWPGVVNAVNDFFDQHPADEFKVEQNGVFWVVKNN